MTDTQYKCTKCGQVSPVGRCCGEHTRIPLNEAARRECGMTTDRETIERLEAECQALALDAIRANARANTVIMAGRHVARLMKDRCDGKPISAFELQLATAKLDEVTK